MTEYDIWLNRIPGIGSRVILRLWKALGCRRDFAAVIYEMKPEERKKLTETAFAGVRNHTAAARAVRALLGSDTCGTGRCTPEQCLENIQNQGIQCVCFCDEDYPRRLRHIPDPPFALYYYGHLPKDSVHSVGIVGTRMASPYGREQARRFAMELARGGAQVISGMARGIDGVAGKAALEASAGSTSTSYDSARSFAVLGCGVDICYPKENLELYNGLRNYGGVISEYPPGTKPEAGLFPARNRIISGLSDLVLVIEAREKSGTLITVDQALEQGRDVFALPGRISDRNSAGCNNLIRQGAGIALSPETIQEYLVTGVRICREPTTYSEGESPAGYDSIRKGRGASDFEILTHPEKEKETDQTEETGKPEQAGPDGLNELEKAILYELDESTPKDLDGILPDVEKKIAGSVTAAEAVRTMTKLSIRGLVREVRIGYYVSVT